MKIGIVVPILNNFLGFTDLVSSIKTKHDYAVYVEPQYRAQVPLAAAWNRGALKAFEDGCDYALVCNDDIMFAPECIDNMVSEYERLWSDKVIMVTSNNILGELGDPYKILDYRLPERQEVTFSDHPNFSCFLIDQEYFARIGTFDENFDPAWWEDNDAHYRAHLLGYKLITTTAAPMVHLGAQTTSLMANPPSSAKSEGYFFDKWGSKRRDLNENFKTPYNDPNLTAKDWIKR
jgi:hypothetical protein